MRLAAPGTEQEVGYWQQAGEHASDRSAYLEAISHFTTGIELLKTLPETPARCWTAYGHQLCRDVPAVNEQTEATVVLATEQGFPLWVALSTSLRGWALQGQGEAGMARVRQGIAAWRATGAALQVPYLCTVLADVSARLDHTEAGLQALAEAHTLVQQQEERWWEAEVCRLQGVWLLRQPGRHRRRRRKPGCRTPWMWPAARRRSRSSCAPP